MKGSNNGQRNLLLGILFGAASALGVQYASLGMFAAQESTPSLQGSTPSPQVAVSVRQPATRLPNPLARAMAQRVQQGGLIIYFRHAQRQKWDSVIAFDLYEMVTGSDARNASWYDAVCLTPQGIEEAKMIGAIFTLANIPVGSIVASPSCRAQQTAELAFGHIDQTSMALVHTPALNVDNLQAFRTELASVLREIPLEGGRNAVVVAHTNTLENNASIFAAGIEYLADPLPLETGSYVIERSADGQLSILYEFESLGELAASAIMLDAEALLIGSLANRAGSESPSSSLPEQMDKANVR